ncbi:uncharacterized protein [Drosophila bipectinata]|uniref:uncharacterized protein n=1 Tax=Drosophila bipectinata TaxID=42026 RepID=UPI001C8A58DC|nr:uncharacterized protein LOC108131613 [Drosophila bipectinata]
MFWATLSKAFTRRQNSSASGSGGPPKKPSGSSDAPKPPGSGFPPKPPGPKKPPKKKVECKTRTMCNPAAYCAESEKFVSMWEPPKNRRKPYPFVVRRSNELCCEPNCTKPLPSFDELYYWPSCKDRQYPRHWVECPQFMMRVKKVCAYDKLEALSPARRSDPRRERVVGQSNLSGCCPHLAQLARCIKGRKPPSCFKAKTPSCCRKLCAPVPSWSECKKPPLAKKPSRPLECECKRAISLCEVERGRVYALKYGENHVCPAAIRKYKERLAKEAKKGKKGKHGKRKNKSTKDAIRDICRKSKKDRKKPKKGAQKKKK